MSRHTQGSLAIVGTIGAGIFLVAFVALLVLGDYTFSPAVFLAALIALLATLVLYLGFGGSVPSAHGSHDANRGKSTSTATASKPAVSAAAEEPAPTPKPAAAAPPPEPAAKPEPAPAPEPEPAVGENAETTPDYDGDGVREGTNEGTRPAGLDAPRDGKADDLKQIKGVGKKMEELCNSLGFWHFDQIANWTADEVAWVDANLQGFKGRVTRDDWVEQAKILAEGGETEFSKRVEDGDVY